MKHALARAGVVILLCLSSLEIAVAQSQIQFDEELDFDRPEAWAMKYFASVSLFTGLGVPRNLPPGSVDLGLELDWVPSLSEAERTVGFNGTKEEDLNRTEFFVRPRLQVGLPKKFSLALSWVPPIEAFNVKPNLLSLAIGRPIASPGKWRFGLRVAGQYGKIQGDFTCTQAEAAAGPDRDRNPFLCEAPSSDEIQVRSASLELSGTRQIGKARPFEPYFSIAANLMDLEFQVDALYSGLVDRTRLLADGETYYVTAGFQYLGWKRSQLGVELFYTPLDVLRPPSTSTQTDGLFNARTFVSYTLR